MVNSFGIVRSSLDQGDVGHPGIDLVSVTGVGSSVTRGQQIDTNPLDALRSNHLELAWASNNFLFHRVFG